eukprot:gene7373-1316_t
MHPSFAPPLQLPWAHTKNQFCARNETVTWGDSFQECYFSCLSHGPLPCKAFAYTNAQWHGPAGPVTAGQPATVAPGQALHLVGAAVCMSFPATWRTLPGCLALAECSSTQGACQNWDTYTCADPPCTEPPAPPAPHVPLSVSPALGSHMVLQRDSPYQIWGKASAGDTVSVVVECTRDPSPSGKVAVTAGMDTEWTATLPARAHVDGQSCNVTVTAASSTGSPVFMDDVVFGDVWGCHGQSNMDECANSSSLGPYIRLMTFTQGQPWTRASPQSTCDGGKAFSPFSAVCWFFGKTLHEHLPGKVPIGLVSSNVGGTAVERWSSPDALDKCNQTGIDKPLLPMAISGWTWYQGESNVASNDGWAYKPGLNCGIDRDAKGAANPMECANYYKFMGTSSTPHPKPFLFVQLAPYTEGVGMPHDTSTALVREAQTAALSLPVVGMASAVDYGDTGSPAGNIHPRNKQPVSLRLAFQALDLGYQQLTFDNPFFDQAVVSGNQIQSVCTHQVNFTCPQVVAYSLSGPCPVDPSSCAWMSVNSVNTTYSFDNSASNAILVDIPSGAHPPYLLEYLFGDWPIPTLHTIGGCMPDLPVPPFRTVIKQ